MRGRRIAVGALLAVVALLWFAAIFGLWVQRQALDTESWVSTSSSMLRNEEIRTAVSTVLVERLYSGRPVEQELRTALPPRLDPLAAPAAAGLEQVAVRTATGLLGTDAALTVWEAANRRAHEVLLRVLGGSGGEVTLDLQALLRRVAEATGLPASAAERLPADRQELVILRSDQLATAQDVVKALRVLPWIFAGVALALIAVALAISPDRRRTVVMTGACFLGAGVAALALRHVAGDVVVDHLALEPNARAPVDAAWGIATSLLLDAATGSILLGAFVLSGAWLAGAGRRATALRRAAAPAFREHPATIWAGLGVLLLLLVLWDPVPWTGKFFWVLAFALAAAVWLEWIRRRTLKEFPVARG